MRSSVAEGEVGGSRVPNLADDEDYDPRATPGDVSPHAAPRYALCSANGLFCVGRGLRFTVWGLG